MKASTLSYALETLHDGATVFIDGSGPKDSFNSNNRSSRVRCACVLKHGGPSNNCKLGTGKQQSGIALLQIRPWVSIERASGRN